MLIKQTRIQKVNTHLGYIEEGASFIIALSNLENHKDQLKNIGFESNLEPGQQLLPGIVGTVSKFNAEGKQIKLRDQPMETAYRQQEWTWEDWGGHSHSKIVDVPYQRYPREFIPPPSEELTIIEHEGRKLLISNELIKTEENSGRIKHLINMYLEIFGECLILDEDYDRFNIPEIKRKNWQFLPPGEYPWDKAKEVLEETIKKAPEGKQPVIEHRIQTITQHNPKQLILGRAGFDGYIVFAWPNKDLYILEHPNYGNATYVFNRDWQHYSNLTKKEIIDGDLHEYRFIHRKGWPEQIKHLLN